METIPLKSDCIITIHGKPFIELPPPRDEIGELKALVLKLSEQVTSLEAAMRLTRPFGQPTPLDANSKPSECGCGLCG